MRMWMCDPKIMCRQHLLGEHRELHTILGIFKKGTLIDGYIKNNCIEPRAVWRRHKELVREMKRRGYQHHTPIGYFEFIKALTNVKKSHRKYKINKRISKEDLLDRCDICNENYILEYI